MSRDCNDDNARSGRSYRLLETMQRIQLNLMDDARAAEVYEDLLAAVLDVTESEYGFVAEAFVDEDGAPYMKARAFTDIAWDAASRAFVAQAGESGLLFDKLDTLLGLVLVSGQLVISNDPTSDPRRGGLPSGHPPLRAFMGLPIVSDGRMIGVIGLANRVGGYDKALAEELEPLVVSCASVIRFLQADAQRRRTEEELLRYRGHLEDLVEGRAREIEHYQQELAEARRMAFMGTLTAGLAHQINNPVGAILMNVQYALRCADAPDRDQIWRESLERAEAEALRCGTIVKGLLNYSRNDPVEFAEVCLARVCADAISACDAASRAAAAQVRVDGGSMELPVYGNAIELQEVLVNVLDNAIRSRERAAQVWVRLSREERHACVRIEDDGEGVDEAIRDRVFEPFFTTRPLGAGTGLGLSVAHGIVSAHGGRISLHHLQGGGTQVSIRIPLR